MQRRGKNENQANRSINQRKVIKDFMHSLDLAGLSRFTDFNGTPSDAFCNILAENGKQYALYIFHGAYEGDWGAHFIPESGDYQI
jgi:hypothetical protein